MSRGTTHRAIRVDDALWNEAKEAASEQGQNLSEVVREALRGYVNKAMRNESENEIVELARLIDEETHVDWFTGSAQDLAAAIIAAGYKKDRP